MNTFESNAISFLLTEVDKIGADMVAKTYHNLVHYFSPAIYTLTAIYIGFVFLKMQRGHFDANDFMMIVLRTVLILTLVMNYEYFCLFIYDVFTNEPLIICKAITINGNTVSTGGISHALDGFLNGGRDAAARIFSMGSWSNPTYLVFGIFIFIVVLLATAFAAGLIVLAKCASVVLLALSPIFIYFAMYDATKGLFESYIRQLITYALIPIMTSAVLMILLSITGTALASLNSHSHPNFVGILPLGIASIIQIYLLLQVKGKCAALSGGFCLPTVMSTFRQSKSDVVSVGYHLANTTRQAGRYIGSTASAGRQMGANLRQRLSRFNKD